MTDKFEKDVRMVLGRKGGTGVPGWTPEICARISLVIEELGGLKKAAEIAGTSDETLANWRDGRTRPTFFGMAALTEATGRDLNWLAKGEDDAPPLAEEGDAPSPPQSDAKPRRWTLWGHPAAGAPGKETPTLDFGGPTAESDALWEQHKNEDLYGQAAEAIETVYRQVGYNTSLRAITNQAVRIVKTIEAAGGTPDQQQFALRVAVDQLRADLRRALADPISPLATKSRA